MNRRNRVRRRFLKNGAMLARLRMGIIELPRGQMLGTETLAAPAPSRRDYGDRSHFENGVRIAGPWAEAEFLAGSRDVRGRMPVSYFGEVG